MGTTQVPLIKEKLGWYLNEWKHIDLNLCRHTEETPSSTLYYTDGCLPLNRSVGICEFTGVAPRFPRQDFLSENFPTSLLLSETASPTARPTCRWLTH